MKNIKLKSLELKNFKGIKELVVLFDNKTNIFGDNGIGKSTVEDSFMWLFFDKDSNDRKNFDIKPFDELGNVIHGLESEVTAVIEIDKLDIKLSKTFKEKWTKKRGAAEKEFSGHETIYSINDIPVRKKEYEEKIKEILEEKIFKLVTNPLYFASLNWKEQRTIIQAITGQITDEQVINYNNKLEGFRGAYMDSVDNHMIRTKATIKKLNDQLKQIPYRIDELNNSIEEINVQELENEQGNVQKQINELDSMLEDNSKGNEILLNHKQHLFELKEEYQEKFNHAKLLLNKPLEKLNKELFDKRYELQNKAYEVKEIEKNISTNENKIRNLVEVEKKNTSNLEGLRIKFENVKSEEFKLDENSTICPTCGKELDNAAEIIEELKNKFNKNKADKLKEINKIGKSIKTENAENESKIGEIKAELFDLEKLKEEKEVQKLEIENNINELEEKIKNFDPGEIEFEGKVQLENEIEMTKKDISSFKVDDNFEIKEKKKELLMQLEKINKRLATVDNNKKIKKRIEELSEEERHLANEIAKHEGSLYLCEEFIRTKVELSESLINKKFKNIKFKLFNELINGGLEETCEILINGVPYSNANSTGKINAGIEVINTLSEFYNVQAPIWVDNAESFNKLADTKSQLIRLIVSKDKKLKVECEE
ncbi:AAA family ATPase [Clostridium thermobutyricum]|uniref:Nuclease SbcCD subunit C n=1 Tax=Clostridium thermobutyricum DSM 4928 TaxID=1121339 RepID=A0A1V4SW40_9CLOT|nr:AAA family ATPase [Clostridium thermobutyricum]OPX48473.1 chromosome partition protein Smc [Clostridium thermobutyricum DSM 4928]